MGLMHDVGNQCRALASHGWTVAQISVELGISHPVVVEALTTTNERIFERARVEHVRWLRDHGWSVAQIARELCMSTEFVLQTVQPSINSLSTHVRNRS
jgi:orotate phosphoribosyltransferase-like protein